MDEQDFRLRAEIIKIQDLLSDSDRTLLHFYFGKDIPRRLQDDGALSSALEAVQALLDRLKISKNNVDYLINALNAIQRHDCAQRLIGEILLLNDCKKNRNPILYRLSEPGT